MSKPKTYDFSGWATRNNIKCSDGRTILAHAFKGNDGAKVPLVWNHDHNDANNVLGHAVLEDREEGVYAYCSFNDTEQGENARKLVSHGDICSLSIYANQLKQNGKKEVMHGNIREVSLVLAGANPGAYIENVISHADTGESEEAKIFNDGAIEMFHAEEENGGNQMQNDPNKQENPEQTPNPEEENQENQENLQHKDPAPSEDKTVQDVVDTMNEEQRNVLELLVGAAYEEGKNANGGNQQMKHNVFEGMTKDNGEELSHSEFVQILDDAKKNGSMKEAFLAHGITNVGELFPEYQAANKQPETVSRNMDWVAKVMAGVHHTPFSRVKSTYINITGDEARARGYVKGRQKVEEVIAAFKRKTDPQTVYKLQKIDRDDVIDITDFDVIAYLKAEMRTMLDEELARAFLIGDGRSSDHNDKIDPLHIRPIWGDSEVYTVKKILEQAQNEDEYAFAKRFIKEVVKARKDYKGSGNPTLYTTEDMLTNMLLIEDLNGRVIYDTVEKLKTALRVVDIVTVEPMEGAYRRDENFQYDLLGLVVNLKDYNVGADKGGQVNMFDDFDINYNKQEYLIETRCSGALVKPYSAISFEKKHSF